MIIDAHNHPDWRGHDLDKFLENMQQYNIDMTWLLSWESPLDEYDPHANFCLPHPASGGPIPFARCLNYAERAPGKFVLGHAPDPRRPEAIDHMTALMEIYDVKIYGELKLRMMFDNLDALRMFNFCGEKNLPVVFHIDYELERSRKYPRPNYWYMGGHDSLERALQACPGTTFIGHAPGFWARISDDQLYKTVAYPDTKVVPVGRTVELMRKYPNLYCDLSGGSGCNALTRDMEHAKDFVLEFQDRLLYGRDLFDNRHQEVLEKLQLPKDVLEKIYSGNALRLVPLD